MSRRSAPRRLLPIAAVIGAAAAALAGRIDDDATRAARERMVRDQIEGRGVRDRTVLAAPRRVPRHPFVPDALRARGYDERDVIPGRFAPMTGKAEREPAAPATR